VSWVDLLARKHCKDLIIESLKYCIEKKGLIVYAYVIMSNHLHLIASAKEESIGLSGIIRDFKKFTSKEMITWMLATKKESRRHWMLDIFKASGLNTYRNENFQIWNHDSHPYLLTSPTHLKQKLDYIHFNPVKAGLVRKTEDYIYSSAGNYAGRTDTVLEISVLDLGEEIGSIYC
jgi:REP element-mobilizing transposase RayT